MAAYHRVYDSRYLTCRLTLRLTCSIVEAHCDNVCRSEFFYFQFLFSLISFRDAGGQFLCLTSLTGFGKGMTANKDL